jgi:uncharacterized protein YidB (DUF937 family)
MCCEFEEMAIQLARNAQRAGGANSRLVNGLMKLIEHHDGGLPALRERFRQGGLARQFLSWVGRGDNLPLPACAVRGVLGEKAYDRLKRRLDLETDEAAAVLAEALPQAIDRLTPNGRIEPPRPRFAGFGWFGRLLGAH